MIDQRVGAAWQDMSWKNHSDSKNKSNKKDTEAQKLLCSSRVEDIMYIPAIRGFLQQWINVVSHPIIARNKHCKR